MTRIIRDIMHSMDSSMRTVGPWALGVWLLVAVLFLVSVTLR